MATGAIPPTPPSGPAPSQIQTRKPFVGFNPAGVPPSQYVFLGDNDWITLTVYASATGAFQLTYRYRFLNALGEIKEGTFVTPALGAGLNQIFTFQIGEGWLLSITAEQSNLVLAGEWAWTQIGFTRSNVGTILQQGFIWEGYVFFNSPTGWPGAPTKDISDGAGFLRSVIGSTPAAGADISEVCPTLRRRQILAAVLTLTTSATVANRIPMFILDDGVNAHFRLSPNVTQVASTTQRYVLAPGLPIFNDQQGNVSVPIPTIEIQKSSYRITTSTIGIQAGDQWASPKYTVLEWGTIDL